jgi:hypothetical protein
MAETYNGYCVKCKEKRDFDGEVHETNGRRMAKGTCPVCGTKMKRILGKASHCGRPRRHRRHRPANSPSGVRRPIFVTRPPIRICSAPSPARCGQAAPAAAKAVTLGGSCSDER